MWAEGIVVQDWRGIHTLPLPCGSWCACARREQLELELGNGAGGDIPRGGFLCPLPSVLTPTPIPCRPGPSLHYSGPGSSTSSKS